MASKAFFYPPSRVAGHQRQDYNTHNLESENKRRWTTKRSKFSTIRIILPTVWHVPSAMSDW